MLDDGAGKNVAGRLTLIECFFSRLAGGSDFVPSFCMPVSGKTTLSKNECFRASEEVVRLSGSYTSIDLIRSTHVSDMFGIKWRKPVPSFGGKLYFRDVDRCPSM